MRFKRHTNEQYVRHFTYWNNGTPFVFAEDRYAKVMGSYSGQSMLQIHAELVLDAQRLGRKNIELLDDTGAVVSQKDLEAYATPKGKK